MKRGPTAVDGNTVYVNPEYRGCVWAYDLKKNKWTKLPHCPQRDAGLAVVDGLLTAVGGKIGQNVTNTLVSLINRKWTKHFPPMPVKLYDPAAVCTGNHLAVVANMERRIHVMDTTSLKWFFASSLPLPLVDPSITVCGTELYVLDYKFVFSCSLPTLVESSSAVQPETTDMWRSVANVPVINSTPTTLYGQLIAVGGLEESKPVRMIHRYNPSVDSWHVIGHMLTPRYECIVATLPGDTLVVIGGKTTQRRTCDVVEVAYPM